MKLPTQTAITTAARDRFRIIPFENRTGTQSWRVTGTNRQGKQIRENFTNIKAAQCRKVELTTEWLARHTETTIRATKLTETQCKLAETAFDLVDADHELLLAVQHWLKHGRHTAVVVESPRLDDAVKSFKAWLDGDKDENGNGVCTLRDRTRDGLRNRVNVFSNSIGNLRVNDITSDVVEGFLGKLQVSLTTRDNYKRALSRFFSWCIQRPRRWTLTNPCREIRVEQGEKPPPAILTVGRSAALLKAAEPEGLAPYVALCLFGGLRPFEAARLDWSAVNLVDREIRLEGTQTKTGKPRVVEICDTLFAWLKAYDGQPLFPANWRKKFDAVKALAGFGGRTADNPDLPAWPVDVMRHTAISHYFRKTGSYGQTAEQFGNSEAIIKNHYQGRVSSEDTKKFYALRPQKGAK